MLVRWTSRSALWHCIDVCIRREAGIGHPYLEFVSKLKGLCNAYRVGVVGYPGAVCDVLGNVLVGVDSVSAIG